MTVARGLCLCSGLSHIIGSTWPINSSHNLFGYRGLELKSTLSAEFRNCVTTNKLLLFLFPPIHTGTSSLEDYEQVYKEPRCGKTGLRGF